MLLTCKIKAQWQHLLRRLCAILAALGRGVLKLSRLALHCSSGKHRLHTVSKNLK